MKIRISLLHATGLAMALALMSVVFTGCKSTPKIDWNTRVGNYTYDQAVLELGPPDKSSPLGDGSTVADWIEHSHGGGVSFGVGTGFSTGHSAVGVGQSFGTGYSDHFLRLTFGPDHRLVAWKKY